MKKPVIVRRSFTRMAIKWALVITFVCIAGTGCTLPGPSDEHQQKETANDGTAITQLDVIVTENRPGEAVFDITMDDFIESYNSLYMKDQEEAEAAGEAYLPPAFEWGHYNTMAIHGGHEVICRTFSEDESIRSIPTMSIYVPTNGDHVQQIMISYDDHSYSIPTYEMYEEMCVYAVRVMLPDTDKKTLTELCGSINDFVDENKNDRAYSGGAVPLILYHSSGVGIYPYCALGEELHFCVIPVTEEILAAFAEQGTAIYEVPTK